MSRPKYRTRPPDFWEHPKAQALREAAKNKIPSPAPAKKSKKKKPVKRPRPGGY